MIFTIFTNLFQHYVPELDVGLHLNNPKVNRISSFTGSLPTCTQESESPF